MAREVWKTKEARITEKEDPRMGDATRRGILLEAMTATLLLMAGADILIMRHPEAVEAGESTDWRNGGVIHPSCLSLSRRDDHMRIPSKKRILKRREDIAESLRGAQPLLVKYLSSQTNWRQVKTMLSLRGVLHKVQGGE